MNATFQQYERVLRQRLTHNYEETEARIVIRWLIEYVAKTSWSQLSQASWEQFPEPKRLEIETGLARLAKGEPLQYIIGFAHFYGRDFEVSPSVLIPRRETEELMDWVKTYGEQLSPKKNDRSIIPIQVLDIGTGSGCIPITLALEWEQQSIPYQIQATDVSKAALILARRNSETLGATVSFLQQDIGNSSPQDFADLDIIVSNPPYVPSIEKEEMLPRVLEHEPELALFVPDETPLIFYQKIAEMGKHWLKSGGRVFFEIHESFGPEIIHLLEKEGYTEIELRRDMQGKDRMVAGNIK